MSLSSLSTLSILAGVLLLAGYVISRALTPKPLPGIPYDAASAGRLFGDVPDLLKHQAKTQETLSFLGKKCVELRSPIIQVFFRPLGRPWVVIADSQEAQDIMVRRTREFDRSEFFGDLLESSMPHHHVWMKMGDEWRAHRRLVADTMSPAFLDKVAGPQAYTQFAALVDLWRTKATLAQGHPVDVAQDVQSALSDSICAVTFGTQFGATKVQSKLLGGLNKLDELAAYDDSVAVFPRAASSAVCNALADIANSSGIPMNSPFGKRHHAFALRIYPTLRRAVDVKNRMIRERLYSAWLKFNRANASEDDIKSAADLIVEREVTLAKKQGRTPQYDSLVIQDELFGFVTAGHDTTATSVEWGLKFLTAHQEAQVKLRQSLRSTFESAAKSGQAPSASDIVKASPAYLDAVIEEVLRCGANPMANMRVATQDTEIFGYRIPKGTDVFVLNHGPSVFAPPLSVDDAKRSKTSRLLSPEDRWTGSWDPSTLHVFDPERWLQLDEKTGEKYFDARSGPMQAFGAGLRGCFGRKLAYLKLRIMFTLVVWNFELMPLPEELGTFAAKDMLAHRPQKVYLRLRECGM